jgi:uncharacterized protein YggT (Ycf19 family)
VLNTIFYQVFRGIYWVLNLCSWAIVLRAILSWFLRPDNSVYNLLLRVTEPMIAPFRPLAYRITNGRLPIDLAPLFSYIALMILMRLVSYGMVYVLYGI